MWNKSKFLLNPVDSKIVKRDFIIAKGSTLSPSLLDEKREENPFKRSIFAPFFYIFKVHKGNPMRIFSSNYSHIHIYPANKKKGKNMMPARVYEDKKAYDLAAFLLVPYKINDDSNVSFKNILIKEGFVSKSGKKNDISLISIPHKYSISQQDSLIVSEVMPSQVIPHLFSWLTEGKKIYSHEKTFDQRFEGTISIPRKELDGLVMDNLENTLEKRYHSKLSF